MKIVVISDIHLGPEKHYKGVLRKITKNVKKTLGELIIEIKNNIKPEFVVVLGDLIEHENTIRDKKNIAYITNLFRALTCPTYYVAGNHDLINLSSDELANLLGQEELYYSFDVGDFHFIVLFSEVQKSRASLISDRQKDWLSNDLGRAKKKSIVFVHHGLSDQNLTGNPWFEGRPENCLISNRREIRKILSDSGKVIAVFNAHLHWNKKDVHESIPYFTLQSLTENENDKGIPSEAYAVIDFDQGEINVDVRGNYPITFKTQY